MNKSSDKGLRSVIVLLAGLAVLIFGYDLYEVVTGQVDLNQHLPFLLPAVFGIFILIAWKIGRMTARDPETAAKVRAEFRENSGLNPRNTSRADEGRFE